MSRGGAKPIKRGKYAERRIGKILKELDGSTITKTEAPFTTTSFGAGAVTGGFYGSTGALDFEGGYWGKFVAIEVKRFDGVKQNRWNFKSNVSKHQIARLKKIDETRGTAAVVILWDCLATDDLPHRWFWVPAPAIVDDIEAGVKSWSLDVVERLVAGGHVMELPECRVGGLKSSVLKAIERYT